jgi:dUTP pyrophosphatase
MRIDTIKVKVQRLAHAQDLPIPAYQTEDAAGMDLLAALPANESHTLAPGGYAVIPTGLTLELPHGTEAQVRPRSGLAAKFGVTILNSPGTIDADYRGEVGVILINHGKDPYVIRRGDRIAQMVIGRVAQARIVESKSLSATKRGAGGFGSTGVKHNIAGRGGPEKRNTIAAKPKTKKTASHSRATTKPR